MAKKKTSQRSAKAQENLSALARERVNQRLAKKQMDFGLQSTSKYRKPLIEGAKKQMSESKSRTKDIVGHKKKTTPAKKKTSSKKKYF